VGHISERYPSDDLTACQADIELTKKLSAGGRILEITVLDGIIITSESYFSFVDEGLF
jgi:DNA repair protein RadC